jgi:hypothetical protein
VIHKSSAIYEYACGNTQSAQVRKEVEAHLDTCDECRDYVTFMRDLTEYFEKSTEIRRKMFGVSSGAGPDQPISASPVSKQPGFGFGNALKEGLLNLNGNDFLEQLSQYISNLQLITKVNTRTPQPSNIELKAIPPHWREFTPADWQREFDELDRMEAGLLQAQLESSETRRIFEKFQELRHHYQAAALYMLEYHRSAAEGLISAVKEVVSMKAHMIAQDGVQEENRKWLLEKVMKGEWAELSVWEAESGEYRIQDQSTKRYWILDRGGSRKAARILKSKNITSEAYSRTLLQLLRGRPSSPSGEFKGFVWDVIMPDDESPDLDQENNLQKRKSADKIKHTPSLGSKRTH